MFKLNKKECKYVYIAPADDGDELDKWALLDQDGVNQRLREGTLKKNARLFRIDREMELHFETTILIK
jgi:hypothetical protein